MSVYRQIAFCTGILYDFCSLSHKKHKPPEKRWEKALKWIVEITPMRIPPNEFIGKHWEESTRAGCETFLVRFLNVQLPCTFDR